METNGIIQKLSQKTVKLFTIQKLFMEKSILFILSILIINNFQLSKSFAIHHLDSHNHQLYQQQQNNLINNNYQEFGNCNTTYYDDNLNPILNITNFPQLQQQHQQQQQQSSSQSQISIGFECQFINGEQLHDQFNRVNPEQFKVVLLIVRDSNLTTLSNLPQGTHELKKMVISNTSIDLEVLKEGSESLNQLTVLEIKNEKISNIPQNFFQEMYALKELRLENDEIASLDGDAFHNLDDSLEILDLHNNRFNRFPMAVKNLAQLNELDLTDNDIFIDTQDNDLPEKLEFLFNLQKLSMNRINCTCEFSSSPFFEWIARTHMSGVRCSEPENLKFKEVIVFERDEFCPKSSASNEATTTLSIINNNYSYYLYCYLLLLIVIINQLMPNLNF